MKPSSTNSNPNARKQVKALLKGGAETLAPPTALNTTEGRQNSPSRVNRGAANVRRALSPGNVRRASSVFLDPRRLSVGGSGEPIDQVHCSAEVAAFRLAAGGSGRCLISPSFRIIKHRCQPRHDDDASCVYGHSMQQPRLAFIPGDWKPIGLVPLKARLELGKQAAGTSKRD